MFGAATQNRTEIACLQDKRNAPLYYCGGVGLLDPKMFQPELVSLSGVEPESQPSEG
jgi:hypothetical protein